MKKNFSKILKLWILVSCFALASCKNDDPEPTIEYKFAGKYTLTSAVTTTSNTALSTTLIGAIQAASPCGNGNPPNPALIELLAGATANGGNVNITCTNASGITPSTQGTWAFDATAGTFTMGLKLGGNTIIPLALSSLKITYVQSNDASVNGQVNIIEGELPASVTQAITSGAVNEGLKIVFTRP